MTSTQILSVTIIAMMMLAFVWGRVRYDLVQFHYHSPSEHVVDGKSFAAELHLVHSGAEGRLAVVGILLAEGSQHEAYEPFVQNLPVAKGDVRNTGATIDAADLLPGTQTTFRYGGSLTTPPCTEDVRWLVMTIAVEMSSEQVKALGSLFEEGNNRPVQPLNDRSLTEDVSP